jgi:predicted Zn finger-like uncharacterized protein
MILTCPACSTRYLVAATALGGGGRRVRCAKCQHLWHARPPEDAPPPVEMIPSAPAEPEHGRRHDRPRDPVLTAPRYPVPVVPRPPARRWVVLGWVGLDAAIVILLLILGLARDTVVEHWPRAARLYTLVGLAAEPPGAGLEFRQVNTARADDNGAPALVVEGEVANVSSVPRGLPKLKVVLQDDGKRALQSWRFEIPTGPLPPGGSALFRTTIPRPAEAATGLVVTVADGA